MIPSPEMAAKIAIWRQKALDNTLTKEDMREAILALRQDRKGAAIASAKSKVKKAAKVLPDADDLLNELGGL